MSSKQRNIFILLFCLMGIAIFLNLSLGSVAIPFNKIISALFGAESGTVYEKIVWQLRIPKIATAILAGASLSLSGLLMQTFFRNPIAGPFVLGISSGAGLGAAIYIMGAGWLLGLGFSYSGWGLAASSSIGAAVVLLLILAVSYRVNNISTLLIIGMMTGSAVSATVMLLQFFSGREELQRFILWSMGDLGGLNWQELSMLTFVCFSGFIFSFFLAQPLNVLLLGEENAESLGVSVKKVRWMIILTTAILAGSITAFCGPIAFIGIAIPHAARILWKTQRHQILIPGTVILGMSVMLFCQLLATLPFHDKILPINAITSLLGAPAVIWIVLSIKRS